MMAAGFSVPLLLILSVVLAIAGYVWGYARGRWAERARWVAAATRGAGVLAPREPAPPADPLDHMRRR